MLRVALHAVLIVSYTLLAGVPAMIFCVLVPNGDPLLWFARPWAWLIARSCGTRVRASGVERIPRDRACVFVCNHQSHFDVIALILALPVQYRVLAKRELFKIPVFGWALWLAGFVSVDRGDRERAIAGINRAAATVRKGRSVVVFAEGTRSADGSLQPLKKGGFHLARKAGAPIVPVSIRGGRAVLPRGSVRIRPGVMEVVVGEPILAGEEGGPPIDELMRRVRAALLAGLEDPGIPGA
jgi:1-acyl-sn-glycerol-3-phosphate acyltransferase